MPPMWLGHSPGSLYESLELFLPPVSANSLVPVGIGSEGVGGNLDLMNGRLAGAVAVPGSRSPAG
jgi:hypothetical protein